MREAAWGGAVVTRLVADPPTVALALFAGLVLPGLLIALGISAGFFSGPGDEGGAP